MLLDTPPSGRKERRFKHYGSGYCADAGAGAYRSLHFSLNLIRQYNISIKTYIIEEDTTRGVTRFFLNRILFLGGHFPSILKDFRTLENPVEMQLISIGLFKYLNAIENRATNAITDVGTIR